MDHSLLVLLCNQVFVVLFRRSTGRQRHLVPSPVPSPFVALLYGVVTCLSWRGTWYG